MGSPVTHSPGELSRPGKGYHLSLTTRGENQRLERVITCYAFPWGIITIKEDNHLQCIPLDDYHSLERIVTSHAFPWEIIIPQIGILALSKYPWGYIESVNYCPLFEYSIPYNFTPA